MRLDELREGETAVILEVTGDDVLASRLMEMGLIDGESISMIGSAPMGDPTEYSVQGYRLSLRKNEAARVEIARGT
jgi:ferrous iron transport protein A